jgi:hypothetical protein
LQRCFSLWRPRRSKNVGIRKAIVDAQGRFWYMGSHNGRLGVIEQQAKGDRADGKKGAVGALFVCTELPVRPRRFS